MPPGTTPHIASPTGESWQIGHGRQSAVVTEVGATLRSFSLGGEPVIDGFTDGEWSQGGRGQVLAPWPNRLGDGRYTFRGQMSQLPLDEPERGNAIHGLVRWMPWRLEAKAQNMLVVSCMLYPRPGYPFTLSLRIQYHLGRDGLQVTTTAWNAGSDELPFGLGFHPYLTVGTSRVDSASLRVPATARLVADDRGLPTGEVRSVLGTEYDFTTVRPLGPVCLDTCYTDLRRDDEGRATVELRDSGGERSVDLWVGEQFAHLMCFTGDTLEEGRRRRSIAVEPMTCPPDAFRSRTDLVTLEPGGSWIGSWGIRPH
jgi:aldose 1-epimerase